MKSMTLQNQRNLYKQYKKSRLNEANNTIRLYATGNYSKPTNEEIMRDAKNDILNFVSVFENPIIEEAESEMDEMMG